MLADAADGVTAGDMGDGGDIPPPRPHAPRGAAGQVSSPAAAAAAATAALVGKVIGARSSAGGRWRQWARASAKEAALVPGREAEKVEEGFSPCRAGGVGAVRSADGAASGRAAGETVRRESRLESGGRGAGEAHGLDEDTEEAVAVEAVAEIARVVVWVEVARGEGVETEDPDGEVGTVRILRHPVPPQAPPQLKLAPGQQLPTPPPPPHSSAPAQAGGEMARAHGVPWHACGEQPPPAAPETAVRNGGASSRSTGVWVCAASSGSLASSPSPPGQPPALPYGERAWPRGARHGGASAAASQAESCSGCTTCGDGARGTQAVGGSSTTGGVVAPEPRGGVSGCAAAALLRLPRAGAGNMPHEEQPQPTGSGAAVDGNGPARGGTICPGIRCDWVDAPTPCVFASTAGDGGRS